MKTVIDFLHDLELARFYGSIELRFENGRITLARKNESIKLDNPAKDYRNNRGTNGDQQR